MKSSRLSDRLFNKKKKKIKKKSVHKYRLFDITSLLHY